MKKDIHIFTSGPQTSAQGVTREFSKSDLKQIAETYDPQTHEAPIRIGHEDNDKVPSWGWVKGVKLKGDQLYAEVEFSPLMENYVNNGLYKKVSASFYSPESKINPEPGNWSLRHVAMLGAQPPAVKGLKGFAYSEESVESGVFDFTTTLTPDQVFDKELGPTTKGDESPFEMLKEKLDEARAQMSKDTKSNQELEAPEEQEQEQSAFAEEAKVKVKRKKSGDQAAEDADDELTEDEANETPFGERKAEAKKDQELAAKDISEAKFDKKKGKRNRAGELMRDADQDNRDADVDEEDSVDNAESADFAATAERDGKIKDLSAPKTISSSMEKEESNFNEVAIPEGVVAEEFKAGFVEAIEAFKEALEMGGDVEYTEDGEVTASFNQGVHAGLDYAELQYAATVDRNGTVTDLPAPDLKEPNMPTEETELKTKSKKQPKGTGEMVTEEGDYEEKKQGYNDRLDDSLGSKNGKKKQSLKDRRDESEGEEESKGKRKFSGDSEMDKEEYGEPTLDNSNPGGDKKKRGTDGLNSTDVGVKETPTSEVFYEEESEDEAEHGETVTKKSKKVKAVKGEPSGRNELGVAGAAGETGRKGVGKAGKTPAEGGEDFGATSAEPATDGGAQDDDRAATGKSDAQAKDRGETGKAGKTPGEGGDDFGAGTPKGNSGGPSGSGSAIKSPKIRVEQIKAGETTKQLASEYSELNERLVELEAQNAKLVQEKVAAEHRAHRLQLEEFTESLYAHGKLTAATMAQEELTDYIEALEYGTVEFSEGESQASKLMTLLAQLPSQVSYAEIAGGGESKIPFDSLDPHEQAMEISKEEGIDYAEALKRTLYSGSPVDSELD